MLSSICIPTFLWINAFQTVRLSHTREDLDRIQLELELDIEEDDTFAAAVRVSNDEEERQRYAEDLVRVIVSSYELLLRRHKQERERRREDMRALFEAHASFVRRSG